MSTATIDDIAELAGVSASTVSRALTGHVNVASNTRDKVRKIAAQFGYRPHSGARDLACNRLHTIGCYAPGKRHPYRSPIIGEYLDGMVEEARKANYDVVVSGEHQEEYRDGLPSIFTERRVAGLVVLERQPQSVRQALDRAGIPHVHIAGIEHDAPNDRVDFDHEQVIGLAVSHLASLGHRDIAYLNPAVEHNDAVLARQTAFLHAMLAAGLTPWPHYRDVAEADQVIARFMDGDKKPTAIVCFDDWVAMRCLQVLAKRGIRVPNQVSVMGINDDPVAGVAAPPLATIRQPFAEVGAQAARLLLERIERPDLPPRERLLPGELVVRETTARPGT